MPEKLDKVISYNRGDREVSFQVIASIITDIYGERCSENEAGCSCCCAWAVFDCLTQMTDSSLLDEAEE